MIRHYSIPDVVTEQQHVSHLVHRRSTFVSREFLRKYSTVLINHFNTTCMRHVISRNKKTHDNGINKSDVWYNRIAMQL